LKAREVEEAARADDLLDQVRHLQTHALDILERAEKAGDLRTALAAISQARGNLELLGKLAGELDERAVTNVLISSEWLQLRAVIVGALESHPGAREAVLSALEGASNGNPRRWPEAGSGPRSAVTCRATSGPSEMLTPTLTA
jgi:hypothetical protein